MCQNNKVFKYKTINMCLYLAKKKPIVIFSAATNTVKFDY